MKKLICLLLVLVMCLGAFASCNNTPAEKNPNDGTDNTEGDGTGNGETTGGDATTGGSLGGDDTEDDLSTRDDLVDFPGFETTQEYVIFSRSSTEYEFKTPEAGNLSGVDQAIFNRNAEVSQRANVEISVLPAAGDWNDRGTFMQSVRNDGKLAESEYALIATHSVYLMTLAVEGLGQDFAKLDNIDLSKRWWSDAFYEQTNYNGAQYIAFGDLAHTLYSYMMVFFFNESLADRYSINEDLYDLALDGDWTYAKMKEYVELVTTDTDLDLELRDFGLLTNGHSMRAFLTGFDTDWTEVDGEGIHSLPKSLSAALEATTQSLVDFSTATPEVYFSVNGVNGTGDQNDMFASGKSLFYSQMLGQATYLKGVMQDEYGVLPFPKYSDTQTEYRSGYCDDMTAVMVPYRCKNKVLSGTVTEMLAMVGWREVTDAYYEETLKYQSFNNPKCVASIELVRRTFSPTFTSVYGDSLGTISATVANVIERNIEKNENSTVSNYYGTSIGTWRRQLRDLYTALDKIETDRAAEAS